MRVVPHRVNRITSLYPNDSHVFSWLGVANHFEVRHELRPDFVTACVHHPLLDLVASDTRNAAIVLDAKQHVATERVRKGDDLPTKLARLDVVTLELHGGAFTVSDHLEQLGARHRRNSYLRRRLSKASLPPSSTSSTIF